MIDVSIISSGHHVADARIHRLSDSLTRSGLKVEVIARGEKFDAPSNTAFKVAIGDRGLIWRTIRALLLPFQASGKVILAIDPDLAPALTLRRMTSSVLIVRDMHEDYLALLNDRAWAKGLVGKIARLVAKFSVSLAERADLTIAADDHVPPLKALNRIVVKNLPDYTLLHSLNAQREPLRAVYVGDVRTSRGLKMMLEASELAPEWRFDIIGPIAPAEQSWVNEWQRSSAARDRVVFHGRLNPRDSWKVVDGAQVGLSLLEQTPAFMDAIPTKIYEYAAAGLAILSTPLPRVKAILPEICMVESAAQVAQRLTQWQNEPDALAAVGAGLRIKFAESGQAYSGFVGSINSLLGLPR